MLYPRETSCFGARFGSHGRQHSILVFIGAVLIALLTGIFANLFGEIPALLALLSLFFMAIAIGNYRYGVIASIILLPLSSTNLIPREMFGVTGFNPLNVTLLFSIGTIFLIWLIQPRTVSPPQWPRFFWLYLGAVTFAAFNGALHVSSIPDYFKELQIINFDSVGGYLRDIFLKALLILATAFQLSIAVRYARRPSLYLIPFFCSAVALPIAVIIVFAASGASLSSLASSDARGFLSVLGMHANELGLMFNMAFSLSLFSFFSAQNAWVKLMLGIATTILIAAIGLTFSRGAYLGLLAVVAYFLFTQKRFRTTLVVLSLIAAAAFFMPDAVMDRAMTGLASRNMDDIGAGRVDGIWLPLLPEIFSSPLVGHGLSSILWSESAQHQAMLPVGHPHSAYLGALLDFGVLGSIVIVLFFLHMWHVFTELAESTFEPILRGFFKGAAACILLLLVQGVTDDSFALSHTQVFLWLAYGIAIGLIARSRTVRLGGTRPLSYFK